MTATAVGSNPWHPRPHTLLRVTPEAQGVFSWELAPTEGNVTTYRPGQFNMLYVFGQGESAISLSGDPVRDSIQGCVTHTIRAVGGVTRAMQALKPGATVGVRGPFGSGWPLHEARGQDLLIVAGGLGVAPLRPLIELALRNRADYGDIHILYGARGPADLLFERDLQRWNGYQNVSVLVTVDTAPSGWAGHVGTVTELIPLVRPDADTTVACICGPELMMRFTLLALRQHGLTSDSIFLSMERHMQCALGYCGHCLWGPHMICRDGPVFRADQIEAHLALREL